MDAISNKVIILNNAAVYDDSTEVEVSAFLEAMRRSADLKDKYREEDWEFARTQMVPRLLRTRDVLIQEFKKAPICAYSASSKSSRDLVVDFSSLSADSWVRKKRDLFLGVKVYNAALAVFKFPTYERRGGFKQGRLCLLYEDGMFYPQVKLSLKKEMRGPGQVRAFCEELEIMQKMGGCRVVGESSFSDEMVPLSEFQDRVPSEIPVNALPFHMHNLFAVVQGLLKGALRIYVSGYLHNDYKEDNVLVSVEASGCVQEVKIIDFGFATPIDDDVKNDSYKHTGTVGYYMPGQKKRLASEIYGLGQTLSKWTQPYRSQKLTSEGLPFFKEKTFKRIDVLLGHMMSHEDGRCTLDFLINEFAHLEKEFTIDFQRFLESSQQERIESYIFQKLGVTPSPVVKDLAEGIASCIERSRGTAADFLAVFEDEESEEGSLLSDRELEYLEGLISSRQKLSQLRETGYLLDGEVVLATSESKLVVSFDEESVLSIDL